MNSSPKILVFKLRSLIYTLLLLFFAVVLIVCLVLMFFPGTKKDGQVPPAATEDKLSRYIPGVYTAPVSLGDSVADVEVTLNDNHIQAIRLVNLSEAATAAFPLVSPAFENVSSQVLANQGTGNITAPAENRYTSQLFLSAISEILQKAAT